MYTAGWSKREIAVEPRGYAMHGYGMWNHRAFGTRSPLFCRAIYLRDNSDTELYFCCLDLGYITYAMRSAVCRELSQRLGAVFSEERLVMTCTHTHSGPGGCAHEAMYNVVTPGYVPEHVDVIALATVSAIMDARAAAAPTGIRLCSESFEEKTPVAWNRSVEAYNRNPEVTHRERSESHLALDRSMPVFAFERQGRTEALLSLFGVHGTCVGSNLHEYDGDNKGYAASAAEERLEQEGAGEPVAIFAQGTAGDVSPHFQGPGRIRQRRKIRGEQEYEYARANGVHQANLALQAVAGGENGELLLGKLDGLLSYVDFSRLQAAPEYAGGNSHAYTSEPCHGTAFFAGVPVDGPGIPGFLAKGAGLIARAVRKRRLASSDKDERDYYRQFYDAQGPKDILMEAGRKRVLGMPLAELKLPDFADPTLAELKRQARAGAISESAMVPSVLPLQLITIGRIAIICCPGEITTIAGQRLRETVRKMLRRECRDIDRFLLCSYCNEYMGYITTNEEYQLQHYEGGHTVYGQWTLAAFQTEFARLAVEFGKASGEREYDRTTRPTPPPSEELALRSRLAPPVAKKRKQNT